MKPYEDISVRQRQEITDARGTIWIWGEPPSKPRWGIPYLHLWHDGQAVNPGLNVGIIPPIWRMGNERRYRPGWGLVAVWMGKKRKIRLRLRASISPRVLFSNEPRE